MNRDQIKELDGTWVGDNRNTFHPGDLGFLVRITPRNTKPRLELRLHPSRTHEPHFEDCLYGLVDDRSTKVEALGCAKVESVAPNGRGAIKTVWGDELLDALKTLGYPDLADEV